jgi:hypothetical protein
MSADIRDRTAIERTELSNPTGRNLRASIALYLAGWYLDILHGPISGYTAGGIGSPAET